MTIMLHILRHSPHSSPCFASCLRAINTHQGLLLIEDAVYGLLPGTSEHVALDSLAENISLYTLAPDLHARGLALNDLPSRIKVIDYPMMVELCTEYTKVVSW